MHAYVVFSHVFSNIEEIQTTVWLKEKGTVLPYYFKISKFTAPPSNCEDLSHLVVIGLSASLQESIEFGAFAFRSLEMVAEAVGDEEVESVEEEEIQKQAPEPATVVSSAWHLVIPK